MGTALTIGRIAKLAGVNVETIRYYQRRGLVAEPDRLFDSFRRYPPETVDRILFIKRAQALGFSLDEVATLLLVGSSVMCDPIQHLATKKVEALRKQIDDLGVRLDTLELLVQRCKNTACETHGVCPLIAHLSGEGPPGGEMVADCALVGHACAEQDA